MAVVNRLGHKGGEMVPVGFFAHVVQAGFPRQFDLPIGLVLQGWVVALHLLGLPALVSEVVSRVVALHLLGLPIGFLALVSGEVVMLGYMVVAPHLLGLLSEVVMLGYMLLSKVVMLGYMVVAPHLLGLPKGFLALVSEVVVLGLGPMLGYMVVPPHLLGLPMGVSEVVMLGYMALLRYMALGCMAVALRLLGLVPRVWEGLMNRWERAWWLMRWDLPTTRTVCLTFEQGDRFTVGDSDRAGCNRSEHGCEKRDG